MATFHITFLDAGEILSPSATTDTRARVASAATASRSALQTGYALRAQALSLPGFAREGLAGVVGRISGAISNLVGLARLPSTLAYTLRSQLSALIGRSQSHVADPAGFAGTVMQIAADICTNAAAPELALVVGQSMMGFGSDVPAVIGLSPGQVAQAEIQHAMVGLVRQVGAIEAVQATAAMTFDVYDDAVRVRDQLAELLDGVGLDAADVGDDAGYQVVASLREAMLRDLGARGASLARLSVYTPPATVPALVLAHRLYGDPDRADEIVSRNRIPHPGFVAGGRQLMVVANG